MGRDALRSVSRAFSTVLRLHPVFKVGKAIASLDRPAWPPLRIKQKSEEKPGLRMQTTELGFSLSSSSTLLVHLLGPLLLSPAPNLLQPLCLQKIRNASKTKYGKPRTVRLVPVNPPLSAPFVHSARPPAAPPAPRSSSTPLPPLSTVPRSPPLTSQPAPAPFAMPPTHPPSRAL